MRVLVSGGWFDDSGEGWVDCVTPSSHERLFAFTPPPDRHVGAKGFTGLARLGEELLVCSFNTVWKFTSQGEVTGSMHLPHFNDLHGLTVDHASETVLVCNTGMDSVERLDFDGRWLGRYALTPAQLEKARFDANGVPREAFRANIGGWDSTTSEQLTPRPLNGDYYDGDPELEFSRRKVRDYLHPNSVTITKAFGPCVTLLHGPSLMSLTSFRNVITAPEAPHDGVEASDGLWFTTVSGKVMRWTVDGVETILSLGGTTMSGWCRGLALTEEWGAVGVTSVRGSGSVVPWRGGDRSTTKTGVVWFDRRSGEILGSLDMTNTARGAKIFTILPAV